MLPYPTLHHVAQKKKKKTGGMDANSIQ